MPSLVSSKTAQAPPSSSRPGNMSVNFERAKEAIARAGDLPTLPQVVIRVSNLAADPSTAMSELVRIIRDDPSLTTKILRVANSAFYGMSRHVESLNTALTVLGMRELINLVACISVFRAFPTAPGQSTFDRKAFWVHSAGCGEIARAISQRLKLHMNTEGFTAGLLHDLGKIVLDQYFHDAFTKALELSHTKGISMVEAEDSVIGINHTELGAWLAELWSLPTNICDTIAYHHNLDVPTGASRYLAALVHLADVFCKRAGIGFSGGEIDESLTEGPAWKILSEAQAEIAKWDIEQFMLELKDNVERAREFVSVVSE